MYKFKDGFKGNIRQEEYNLNVPNNFVATNIIKLYTVYGYSLTDVYNTDKKVKSIKVDSLNKHLGIVYEGQESDYSIEYYFDKVVAVDDGEDVYGVFIKDTHPSLSMDAPQKVKRTSVSDTKSTLPVIHPNQLEERIKSSIERFIIDECTIIDIDVNENTSKLYANLELDTDKLSAYVKGIESVLKCLQ